MKIDVTLDPALEELLVKVLSPGETEELAALLERLEEREKEILILRYGIYGGKPLTQREIAAKLNISRSYVSRIEKKAVEKLKEEFDARY